MFVLQLFDLSSQQVHLLLLCIQNLDTLLYHLFQVLLFGFQGIALAQQLPISLLHFPTWKIGNPKIQPISAARFWR